MSWRNVIGLGAALAVIASAAWADDSAVTLRLFGEAPTAKDPAPKRFVIDAVMKPGDSELQSTLEGWFAALDGDTPPKGEVQGSCVEKRCTLTIDAGDGKFTVIGDFGAASGPITARFRYKDENDKVTQQGAVTLRPLAGGVVPGLGALAAPMAVDSAEMGDLLLWSGQSEGFGSATAGEPIGDFQRDGLATWQSGKEHAPTGLLFATDLAQLRADAAKARKAAGWTTVAEAGHGWSASYPAALLPRATRAGAERRFASADGKALLVVAIDAPMSGDAFDAFVTRQTADNAARSGVNYTRVNGDMEMRYEEKGVDTVAAYHSREGGFVRMVFTYPKDQEDKYAMFDGLLQHALQVADEVKRSGR